jgi:CRP/FNR family transcriptional regulator, cyclic AMP receptor protein
MLQYVDFLRKVPLFSELSEDELRQLAGVVREQHYRRNVTIFHINDPGNALFIIKSGMVKVTIEDQTGREIILRILYPMDFFGEMALIESLPRSATVTTQEPTEALVMYRDHFLLLIEKAPRILLNMTATLSRRLRRMNELIRSLAFYDVYGKVARVLLELVTERGRQTEKGMVIDLRFTQQELAELAGMSRETMTRTLRDFQQAGVVHIESGIITILEIDMLRREMDMA